MQGYATGAVTTGGVMVTVVVPTDVIGYSGVRNEFLLAQEKGLR